MFFNSFLTLISHHQHNQFLQAGDAAYLTFGGHVLYESDYLRSLQWHRIGKDSSLQGRNRMRGGAGGEGKEKAICTAVWKKTVLKLKNADGTTVFNKCLSGTTLQDAGITLVDEEGDTIDDAETDAFADGRSVMFKSCKYALQCVGGKFSLSLYLYLSLSLSLSLLAVGCLFVFVAPHSHPNTSPPLTTQNHHYHTLLFCSSRITTIRPPSCPLPPARPPRSSSILPSS
jgi:hypothetical protein